jgi:hypothetical protein
LLMTFSYLSPLAGRGRIASAMRSIVRCNPGEGDYPRVQLCGDSPSPRPSKSELRSSRPRKRGEGEVVGRFNLNTSRSSTNNTCHSEPPPHRLARAARAGGSSALRLPCAPARYRANSASTPRRPRAQPFSTLSGLARLSRRMQECAKRSRPSLTTCASLREASRRHCQGLPSSIQSSLAEKPLQLHASRLPHSTTPPALS